MTYSHSFIKDYCTLRYMYIEICLNLCFSCKRLMYCLLCTKWYKTIIFTCEDLKTTNPIRKIKEVLEWLYNTLYQKFIGNFHVILKLCFWWQCYKPLQDYKQMFVCLFVSRTLWVLVRRLWQSYSSLLRLPKYQHNKLTILYVLYYRQTKSCVRRHIVHRIT